MDDTTEKAETERAFQALLSHARIMCDGDKDQIIGYLAYKVVEYERAEIRRAENEAGVKRAGKSTY